MTLNYVLLWFVIPVSILAIFRLMRYAGMRAEILLQVLILAVTGAMLVALPEVAGYAGFALLAVNSFIPALVVRPMQRAVFEQDFAKARRWAVWLSRIHPTPAARSYPRLFEAMELSQKGDLAGAAEILAPYRSSRAPLARNATAHLFRMQGDWAELLEWIRTEGIEPDKHPGIVAHYLRALGETGQLNELAAAYQRWLAVLEKTPDNLNLARLVVFGFGGRKGPLQNLFCGKMGRYPAAVQQFWLATAEMAGGDREAAVNRLQGLQSTDHMVQMAAQRRLANPPPVAMEIMTPETRRIIADAEQHGVDQAQYGATSLRSHRKAYATLALMLVNLAVFCAETANGGSETTETIFRMGGLWPPAVLAGEWWRVAAANFLHFGPLHLGMNMFALFLLGPFVEKTLGARKYLVAYLGSGIGSMIIILVAARLGWMENELVAGASGAIMGIVGATGAILLRARNSRVAAQRLRSVVLIIALQVVFDQTTPNISAMGHAGGAVVGFALGLLLATRPPVRN